MGMRLAGVLAVAAAAAGAGFGLVVPAAQQAGPALAVCDLGFIDNPATPGQCVPVPGQPQETPSPGVPSGPDARVGDNATGIDLAACDLDQPYLDTLCPAPLPPS